MNFLYAFVSTFLINYFVIWIISLINFKAKKLISGIVISLFNLSQIFYNIYVTWNFYIDVASQNAIAEYSSLILTNIGIIVANAIAYIASLTLLLDGKKIFKSRRQKEYLNAVNKKSMVLPIVAIVILILLAAASLVYAIYSSIHFEYALLVSTVGAYGIALILLGIAYYIFFVNFTSSKSQVSNINTNVINANIINKTKVDLSLLFILNLNNNKYYFKGLLDENHTINYYLGHLLDIYVLTDFGSINTNNEKIIVKGIKVDKIEESILREIKLNRFIADEKYLNILANFENYRIKNIYVDSNLNITKIIEK